MEFEKNDSTMQKAAKLYKYDKHKKLISGIIVAMLIILIFFFLSNLLLPAKLVDKGEVTKIGTEYEFDYLRTFTVYEMSYSRSQQMLEVVMEFANENYDGIDDYYYALSLSGANSKGVRIDESIHDSLITVIRISGVRSFDEAQLLFAPKYGRMEDATDAQTGIITMNKYNLKMVNEINTAKTKVAYLIDRIEIIIENLEKRLIRENNKLEDLQRQIESLKKENIELEDNKSFLTKDELDAVDAKITKNKETINKTNEAKRQKEQQIDYLQKKLNEANSKKEELLAL